MPCSSCPLLKIKVLYWHLWFHEEPLTSLESFLQTKCSLSWKNRFLKWSLKQMVLWKVLWGTQNGGSMSSLQKKKNYFWNIVYVVKIWVFLLLGILTLMYCSKTGDFLYGPYWIQCNSIKKHTINTLLISVLFTHFKEWIPEFMIYKNVFNHYFWLPLPQTCEMFAIALFFLIISSSKP